MVLALGLIFVLVSVPAAFAGFLDDMLERAEEIIEDTTDYIEEKVGDETKEGSDEVFEEEQPGQSPPDGTTAQPTQQPSTTAQPSQQPVAMEVQDRLNKLGYNAGPVDGIPGLKTAKVIAAFQRDHGLGPPPLIWSTVIGRKTEDQRWRLSDTNRKR